MSTLSVDNLPATVQHLLTNQMTGLAYINFPTHHYTARRTARFQQHVQTIELLPTLFLQKPLGRIIVLTGRYD